MRRWPRPLPAHRVGGWAALASGVASCALASSAATAGDGSGARLLRCTWPDGTSLGVVHHDGVPLALSAGAVSGARECATRSTRAAVPQPVAPGGAAWLFEWHDTALGDFFRAEVRALPPGGFVVSLPALSPSSPGRVRCGPLSLPARAELRPAAAACRESEDRSEALQATWHTLRQALLHGDVVAFRSVLSARVELAEGASGDSPQVAADEVAAHLACVGTLTRAGQSLAEWARARPHILTAPTGLAWEGPDRVHLGGHARLAWEGGRWRLNGLNASRAVVLRPCPPPAR